MHQGKDTNTPGPVGSLFSTVASDNAEVVPPEAHRGFDQLWSTTARPDEDPVEGELLDDAPPGAGGGGVNGASGASGANGRRFDRGTPGPGLFSAEPVPRSEDVIDEADLLEEAEPSPYRGAPESGPGPDLAGVRTSTPTGEPLFSSGRATRAPEDPWVDAGAAAGQGAAPGPPHFAPDPHADPAAGAATPPPYQRVGLDGGVRADRDVPDPNGLRRAVARLDPAEVERAAVPIAVCGALLREDEQVLAAVTGQMLGRPAVIVLTPRRVLVVNDRRWQPIVDEFALDSNLVVRGRHDRNVAALSFADATRLSMVDGIGQVALAIELATLIRQVGVNGSTGPGSSGTTGATTVHG